MHSKHLLAPMIGALSFCLAGQAQAQEQREVPYGDLNLASETGRQQLDRRIHRAVRLVCGADSATREDLKTTMSKSLCIKDTSARAMAAKADLLTALEKGGGSQLAALTVRRDH